MNWARDNPDRDFCADPIDEKEAQELRDLLKSSGIADIADEIIRRRVGEMIGRAAFNPAKQYW